MLAGANAYQPREFCSRAPHDITREQRPFGKGLTDRGNVRGSRQVFGQIGGQAPRPAPNFHDNGGAIGAELRHLLLSSFGVISPGCEGSKARARHDHRGNDLPAVHP